MRAVKHVHFLHRLKIAGLILLMVFGGVLLILAARWPFTRNAAIASLEQVSLTEVTTSSFRAIFFPRPGYVAQNVTFTRGNEPGGHPLVTVGKITCRTTWPALLTFTHRISRMELEGVEIYIPAHVPPPVHKHAQAKIKTTVTELIANGTVLEIAPRHQGGQTVRFGFPELALGNVARNKALNFRTDIRNPNPPGELRVSGAVGPLALGNIRETHISGQFRFVHANLGIYKVIAGDLSAEGRFDGTLGHAQIGGNAKIPNFEVTSSRHSVGLTAEYRTTVDGTKGDVVIQSVQAHFLQTTLLARGRIVGNQGKTVSLDFGGRNADIHDLLRLFVTAERPPLEGPITLSAHVVLPPGHGSFLDKLQLDGDFSIAEAEFTNPKTREKVDELSARARGDKAEIKRNGGPKRVSEDLKANIKVRNAVATISAGLFALPGAVVRGAGTYNIRTEAVDVRGELAMNASLSKAASGVKSILLIPLDPFFRKNGSGAVLPVRMTGTYSHPVFKVSLRR